MVSFIFVLVFYFIGILTLSITLFMYFRLAFAAIRHKEVPRWIYKLGQAIQGRMPIKYDNVTDLRALAEASFAIITKIAAIYCIDTSHCYVYSQVNLCKAVI